MRLCILSVALAGDINPDMVVSTRSVDGVAPWSAVRNTIRGVAAAGHDAPFKKPPRSAKTQDQTISFSNR
eukprot:3224248-Pleurochrysis_carterae.AAC.1